MYTTFFWNVTGFNDTEKHQAFKIWLATNMVLFAALLETHVKESNLNPLMQTVCPTWSFTSNHSEDDNSWIILIWKLPLSVTIMHKSKQIMTCSVTYPGVAPFILTAVYASNVVEEREALWADLITVYKQLNPGSSPWIIGGDFNDIMHPSEHSSPGRNIITPQMIDFHTCLESLEIRDLRYYGAKFIWSNKQPVDPIEKKLDRALINEQWLNTFPHSLATFMPPQRMSDHTPCLISLACPPPIYGSKPFKFFNFLSSHPNFLSTVSNAWICSETEDYSLNKLSFKQRNLRIALKTTNTEIFSEIQKRIYETNSLLNHAQVQTLNQPTTAHFLVEKQCMERLAMLMKIDESFFKQKSRIN